MTTQELIQQEAERRFPISNYFSEGNNYRSRLYEYFIEFATFGASLNGWVSVKDRPDFDGEYLCVIVRRNECGTRSQYQKVLSCVCNVFIVNDSETVFFWQHLPSYPESTVTLD